MTTPDTTGLDDIFILSPDAWSPRKAIFRVAHDHLAQRGVTLTPQELYKLLRARNLTETRRPGKGWGFVGIAVPGELATAPRLVPEHSAASYRRGDRAPEAIAARKREKLHKLFASDPTNQPLTTTEGGIVDKLTSRPVLNAALDREYRRSYKSRNWSEIGRLKREAADIERLIDQAGQGTELPESHWQVVKLRALRRRIDSLA